MKTKHTKLTLVQINAICNLLRIIEQLKPKRKEGVCDHLMRYGLYGIKEKFQYLFKPDNVQHIYWLEQLEDNMFNDKLCSIKEAYDRRLTAIGFLIAMTESGDMDDYI